jgi:DNA polymerase III epsilon subunit-like protein
VAHNLNFDYNVLLSELNRADITTKIHSLTKICTMKSTTDYCSISTSKGYKWPSLAELYKKIFLEEMKEAHNAAKDIEATAKCFWYLKKHKLVNFVEIEKYDSINVKNFKVSKLINLEDTIF